MPCPSLWDRHSCLSSLSCPFFWWAPVVVVSIPMQTFHATKSRDAFLSALGSFSPLPPRLVIPNSPANSGDVRNLLFSAFWSAVRRLPRRTPAPLQNRVSLKDDRLPHEREV